MPRGRRLAYGSTHARAPPRPRPRRSRVRAVLHGRLPDRDLARELRDAPPAALAAGLLATVPLAFRCTYPLAAYLVDLARESSAIVNLGAGLRRPVGDLRGRLSCSRCTPTARTPWTAGLGGAVVLIPLAITAVRHRRRRPVPLGRHRLRPLIIGGPWAAGLMIRLRRERERSLTLRTVELERDQDERARAAVAEERARIARELHDVVAHAISVVVVQAAAAARCSPAIRRRPAPRSTRSSAPASRRSARCAGCSGCCATTTRSVARAPQPSLERARGARRRDARVRAAGRARRRGRSRTASRRASTSPATGSCRRR